MTTSLSCVDATCPYPAWIIQCVNSALIECGCFLVQDSPGRKWIWFADIFLTHEIVLECLSGHELLLHSKATWELISKNESPWSNPLKYSVIYSFGFRYDDGKHLQRTSCKAHVTIRNRPLVTEYCENDKIIWMRRHRLFWKCHRPNLTYQNQNATETTSW